MRLGSVCSGVGTCALAARGLGWEHAWFSEIDTFASAVLAYRFPCVPNLGDMTKIGAEHGPVDILVGGTPCQSFSVAGLRKGLADPRGSLALAFLRLAEALQARWFVWENVPGVLSSSGGRDFGAFVGALGELGYGWAYRVLDARYFGVPQRRRRVFVVGCAGDWTGPAAVLFEPDGVRGDSSACGEAAAHLAALAAHGVGRCGADDAQAQGGRLIPQESKCLTGHGGQRYDLDTETFVTVAPTLPAGSNSAGGTRLPGTSVDTAESFVCVTGDHTHALRAEGADAGEDGTGRGTPLICSADGINADPLTAHDGPGNYCKAGNNPRAHNVVFNLRGREDGAAAEVDPDGLASIRAASGGSSRSYVEHGGVRRLTPRECERLQGLPDDWTRIPYRNKPASECPDSPRYKAIGNGWALPVAHWVFRRIAEVDRILRESGEADSHAR